MANNTDEGRRQLAKKQIARAAHFFFLLAKSKFARAARFFSFPCRCFAPLQGCFVPLKRQTS